MNSLDCPCGRNKSYIDCCGLIHESVKEAVTAEDLMRSRYVAFVKGNGTYLQKSHHPNTRPTKNEAVAIEKWAKSVTWLSLEIINSRKGSVEDVSGTVEFKAVFMENGRLDIIHENSYFEKDAKVWKYKNAFKKNRDSY